MRAPGTLSCSRHFYPSLAQIRQKSDIQDCYIHIYFPYNKFRRSTSWENETQILYSSGREISCLGSPQVGPLNVWKCVHISLSRSVCGLTLHQLKKESSMLRLKFTRMAQNIVIRSPSSTVPRYAWLYTSVLHHFHLSFSLFQTHINMLSDSHMAFFFWYRNKQGSLSSCWFAVPPDLMVPTFK
jgi:hypothetical protein